MKRALLIVLYLAGCSSCAVAAGAASNPQDLLLKDYRPRSVYKTPRTVVKKAKYPAIDMHAHAYAKTSEQVAEWVRVMDEQGITKTVTVHSFS